MSPGSAKEPQRHCLQRPFHCAPREALAERGRLRLTDEEDRGDDLDNIKRERQNYPNNDTEPSWPLLERRRERDDGGGGETDTTADKKHRIAAGAVSKHGDHEQREGWQNDVGDEVVQSLELLTLGVGMFGA